MRTNDTQPKIDKRGLTQRKQVEAIVKNRKIAKYIHRNVCNTWFGVGFFSSFCICTMTNYLKIEMCRLKLLNGVAIEFCLIFSVCTCNMVYSVSSLLRVFCKKVSISKLVACLLSKEKSNQRPTIVIKIKHVLSAKEDRKDLLCITFKRLRHFHFNISFISTWNSFFFAPNLFFEFILLFP